MTVINPTLVFGPAYITEQGASITVSVMFDIKCVGPFFHHFLYQPHTIESLMALFVNFLICNPFRLVSTDTS